MWGRSIARRRARGGGVGDAGRAGESRPPSRTSPTNGSVAKEDGKSWRISVADLNVVARRDATSIDRDGEETRARRPGDDARSRTLCSSAMVMRGVSRERRVSRSDSDVRLTDVGGSRGGANARGRKRRNDRNAPRASRRRIILDRLSGFKFAPCDIYFARLMGGYVCRAARSTDGNAPLAGRASPLRRALHRSRARPARRRTNARPPRWGPARDERARGSDADRVDVLRRRGRRRGAASKKHYDDDDEARSRRRRTTTRRDDDRGEDLDERRKAEGRGDDGADHGGARVEGRATRGRLRGERGVPSPASSVRLDFFFCSFLTRGSAPTPPPPVVVVRRKRWNRRP